MSRQLSLPLRKRGGRRKGAGRPRTRPHPGLLGPGVPHLRREAFPARYPVHVTLRVQQGVGYLRGYQRAKVVEDALREARERFGVRIVHYSIQGNHLHLIVEADNRRALSRAMQGLATRIARRLNALAHRRGSVFVDRYHAHILSSRRAVAHAVRYVLGNYRHHTREHLPPRWDDALSSARYSRTAPDEDAPVTRPRTWLLRIGWLQEPVRDG
jgi:REP element-mobilizing transposase RayT